jgi:hypothetical protein
MGSLLLLHRVPGRDRLSSRERRGMKVSKSWRARKSKDEGRAKQSMRKSKESSLREGNWSKVEKLRRCGEEMVKIVKVCDGNGDAGLGSLPLQSQATKSVSAV